MRSRADEQTIRVPAGPVQLEGNLEVPDGAAGVVLFAHGSGSGRHSPRNQAVAAALRADGLGTVLFDLLTPEEEAIDDRTAGLRFDIGLLAERLVEVTDWLTEGDRTNGLPVGYFGASTGGGAALVAAAARPEAVSAVVSRGGRPDLAGPALSRVQSPTLLIVGGDDQPVIALNQQAMRNLRCEKRLHVIPGATHLFSEPGALEEVARLAGEWFQQYFAETAPRRAARQP